MRALFDDPAGLQHHDAVGVDHGGQAVGDDDRRPPALDRFQRVEDFRLGPRIERAGRFVQDQDRRVFQQRAGDGNPLLFAARQVQPSFADPRLEPVGQALDEAADRRAARRSRHLFRARALAAIGDVVADRVVEQHGILRDDADRGAQARLRHLCNILPVHGHAPAGQVVETVEDARERRLARPRRPDHRHRLSRCDDQVDALQYVAVGIIAEADILEPHLAPLDGQRRGAGHILHFRLRIDQVEHRAHVDHALPNGAIDPAEHVERAEQLA